MTILGRLNKIARAYCVLNNKTKADKIHKLIDFLQRGDYIRINVTEADEICKYVKPLKKKVFSKKELVELINILSSKTNIFEYLPVSRFMDYETYEDIVDINVTDEIFEISLKYNFKFIDLVTPHNNPINTYQRFISFLKSNKRYDNYLDIVIFLNQDYFLKSIKEYPEIWAGSSGIIWNIELYRRYLVNTVTNVLPYNEHILEYTRDENYLQYGNINWVRIRFLNKIPSFKRYILDIDFCGNQGKYIAHNLEYTSEMFNNAYNSVQFRIALNNFRSISQLEQKKLMDNAIATLVRDPKTIKQASNYYPKHNESRHIQEVALWKLNYMRAFQYLINIDKLANTTPSQYN